jgi:ABC-2 type transport system permease protein
MDIIYYLVNIMFFKVLYIHTPILAGWSQEQMMVFVAGYLLVDALSMTIFSSNMWWLPFLINKGEVDFYLIRPISPLFFLSLREFSANSFLNLIMALGIFIFALSGYSKIFSILEVFLFLLLLLNGVLIYYCCQMLMIIPVFWTQSSRGFQDLFYSMGISMERPDRIFKGCARIIFTFILPFSLIASFPARLFLEKFHWPTFIHLVLVSGSLWGVMLFFWNKGLKNYSSASS